QSILKENRQKINKIHGYSMLDGSSVAMERLEYGKISLSNIDQILIVSDGLTLPAKLGEQGIWLKTATYAFTEGLDSLLKEVISREEQDVDCLQYPRFKKSDDKSGILIKFN